MDRWYGPSRTLQIEFVTVLLGPKNIRMWYNYGDIIEVGFGKVATGVYSQAERIFTHPVAGQAMQKRKGLDDLSGPAQTVVFFADGKQE